MIEKVRRNYLEINSLKDLKEGNKPLEDYSLSLIDPVDFQLNKFFYKNIGKNHKWVDRLTWPEEKWINYVSNESVRSYVLTKALMLCFKCFKGRPGHPAEEGIW